MLHAIRLLIFVLAATQNLDHAVVNGPTATKIDDYLTRLERLGFSGAIIVGKDGNVILHKAYGYADPAAKTPYTIDTASTVGSITKQFTATAILALEEEGKLSVNDPITKYFKDVPPDKSAITIHQLLTHSAGFPDAIGDDEEATGRDEYIQRAMSRKLLFTPGSGYEYSNTGYSLLAAIIEQVTGATYERYLHDRLFVRAGMEHTGYRIPKWTKLARGSRNGEIVPPFEGSWAPDGPYWHLRGNGGIMTIPADMYRWHLALIGDKVLSAASRKKLFTPYVKEGDAPSHYAYGWTIFPLPSGHQLIAHNGGNGIFAADFRRYLDDGIVIFITSNVSEKKSTAADRFIGRIALGQDVPMPPRAVDVDADKLRTLEGTYGSLKVTAAPNGINVTALDGDALALFLTAPPAERAEPIANRSKSIADAIVHRDLKALQQLFGGRIPLETIEQRQRGLEARNGEIKSAAVIAVARGLEGPMSILRLDFEHGRVYLELNWDGPETVAGIRIMPELRSKTFVATSSTEFASYDFASGETTTLTFEDGKLRIGTKTFEKDERTPSSASAAKPRSGVWLFR
jgi:CubicO group peptidase (beta-lactamase class C family)